VGIAEFDTNLSLVKDKSKLLALCKKLANYKSEISTITVTGNTDEREFKDLKKHSNIQLGLDRANAVIKEIKADKNFNTDNFCDSYLFPFTNSKYYPLFNVYKAFKNSADSKTIENYRTYNRRADIIIELKSNSLPVLESKMTNNSQVLTTQIKLNDKSGDVNINFKSNSDSYINELFIEQKSIINRFIEKIKKKLK